jgi:hypothetical protein
MTTDLNAATERLRRVHQGESVESVYGEPYTTETQEHHYDHPYHVDLRLCLGQFLAEHPADDGEAITEEWLASVGCKKEDHPHKWTFNREDALPVGLWSVADGWKAMLIHTEYAAACIVRGLKTRGDFRQLSAAVFQGSK